MAILADKHHDDPSAFTPESLLREARRQKGADAIAVRKVCLLDPDGDIVRQLRVEDRARQGARMSSSCRPVSPDGKRAL